MCTNQTSILTPVKVASKVLSSHNIGRTTISYTLNLIRDTQTRNTSDNPFRKLDVISWSGS